MDLKTLILSYLPEVEIMQLATVNDGQPWLCTLHFAHDPETLDLYWVSLPTRRHSQEVESYAKTAVTIVISSDKRQALQLEGEAYRVTEAEIAKANGVYSAKFGKDDERLNDARRGSDTDHVYYVFKPKNIVLFDKVAFPINPRQEVLASSLL